MKPARYHYIVWRIHAFNMTERGCQPDSSAKLMKFQVSSLGSHSSVSLLLNVSLYAHSTLNLECFYKGKQILPPLPNIRLLDQDMERNIYFVLLASRIQEHCSFV